MFCLAFRGSSGCAHVVKTSLRWPWILLQLDDLRHVRRWKPYSVSIGLLTRRGQWQAALQLFVELRRQRIATGSGTVAAALMACRQASRWEEALRLEGKELSEVGRNGLVSALVRGQQVEMALERAGAVGSYNSMLMSVGSCKSYVAVGAAHPREDARI